MLLVALELAETGESVLIVDRDAQRGGAWQTTALESDGVSALQSENACHVIEVFPQVYNLLERASGVPFVKLDAQPVRIHSTGLIVPYFGRAMMLLSLMRLVLGYAINWIEVRLLRRGDVDRFENFRTKLSSLLRYQAPEFLRGSPMMGPKDGFVDFMGRLVERCRAAGAQFEHFEVAALVRRQNGWEARDETGTTRTASVVHTTASANLRLTEKGVFHAVPSDRVRRVAIVIEITRPEVWTSQTYAAFWSDPLVSRISRLDAPDADEGDTVRFLVEAKTTTLLERPDLDVILQNRLEKARIIKPGGTFLRLGVVDCLYARNVDQLPSGEIDTDLHSYYSNGNLAAGIAAWLERCKSRNTGAITAVAQPEQSSL